MANNFKYIYSPVDLIPDRVKQFKSIYSIEANGEDWDLCLLDNNIHLCYDLRYHRVQGDSTSSISCELDYITYDRYKELYNFVRAYFLDKEKNEYVIVYEYSLSKLNGLVARYRS